MFGHWLYVVVKCIAGLSKESGAWNWILQIDAEHYSKTLTTQLVQRAGTLRTDTEWFYVRSVTTIGLQLRL